MHKTLNTYFQQYLLSVMMDNIPDSIYFKDLESRFIKVNKGIMKYAGVSSEEEILGKTDFDFFGFEHADEARKDELEIIKTGKPIINKVEKENFPDGRIEWVSTTKIPLKDNENNIIGTFGMSRNITDLIEKEQKINRFAEELIELNKKLTESELKLKESESRLKHTVNTKDKFFSIISHDLRGPFTSMLGILEFLLADIQDMSKQEIQEFVESVHSSSQSVYKLLENLLEWSRVQTGRIENKPENILISEMIEEILKLYKSCTNKKEIEFITEVDKNLFVTADKNMLNTIIRNLVLNAIKFSFEKGKIEIKTNIIDKQVVVSVRDYGTGINEADIKCLFKIDKHITRPGTSMEKGTGLGLILCKEFIENNNGKIWVESDEGKGSTFYFSLPVSPLAKVDCKNQKFLNTNLI